MNNQTTLELFKPLWDDVLDEDAFDVQKPLLAHYTSIETLEKILKSEEIWFSNPLLMNDFEEVRFSMEKGFDLALASDKIRSACGRPERVKIWHKQFKHFWHEFANNHVFDTMVLCFSEHDSEDYDGLLSMWRGYGGNGSGAALVLDMGKLASTKSPTLLLARVHYGTTEERTKWINCLIEKFAEILSSNLVSEKELRNSAYAFFWRLKHFAIFSKHRGFKEEREWRVAYLPEQDIDKKVTSMLDYTIGAKGVETKLKFRIEPIDGITASDLSLDNLVNRILLGPTVSSPLASAAFRRMLDRLGKQNLKEKVYASAIPFRPS